MNTTEHILQCAYRQGYADHLKWQLIPIVGAGSSLVLAGTITGLALASLFSYDLLSLNTPLKISEKKHDLTVLFLNAIANILTAGILNAVFIRACAFTLSNSLEEASRSSTVYDTQDDYDDLGYAVEQSDSNETQEDAVDQEFIRAHLRIIHKKIKTLQRTALT